ncbi:MAG: helix-turn-helix domain-containing protein [Candidatus Altiarchaeota archaeon]|nr:helix-turn-helix domain-containing protein [Candidatus Altiarchaeota archaeon]
MIPDLLTVNEAKKVLRIGRNKVYDLARRRKILYVRIDGKFLFPRSAIEDFIRANVVAPARNHFSMKSKSRWNHEPRLRPVGEEPDHVPENGNHDESHSGVHEPSLWRA